MASPIARNLLKLIGIINVLTVTICVVYQCVPEQDKKAWCDCKAVDCSLVDFHIEKGCVCSVDTRAGSY